MPESEEARVERIRAEWEAERVAITPPFNYEQLLYDALKSIERYGDGWPMWMRVDRGGYATLLNANACPSNESKEIEMLSRALSHLMVYGVSR